MNTFQCALCGVQNARISFKRSLLVCNNCGNTWEYRVKSNPEKPQSHPSVTRPVQIDLMGEDDKR